MYCKITFFVFFFALCIRSTNIIPVFSQKGSLLAIGSNFSDMISFYHVDGGEIYFCVGKTIAHPNRGFCKKLVFSPDENTLVSSTTTHSLVFFTQDKTQNWTVAQILEAKDQPSGVRAYALAFSPDGKTLVSSHNNRLNFWHKNEEKNWELYQTIIESNQTHSDTITDMVFLGSNETFATTALDNKVKIWLKDQNNHWSCNQTLLPENEKRRARKIAYSKQKHILAIAENTLKFYKQNNIDGLWQEDFTLANLSDPNEWYHSISFCSTMSCLIASHKYGIVQFENKSDTNTWTERLSTPQHFKHQNLACIVNDEYIFQHTTSPLIPIERTIFLKNANTKLGI